MVTMLGEAYWEDYCLISRIFKKYRSMPVQVKASFWFLICAFLQKGITSITTPIFTRLLTTKEYGQYGVFNSWMTILTSVVTFNLFSGVFVQGLVKFEEKKYQFSSAMQGLTLTLSTAWTIVYLAFHDFWNGLLSLTTPQMLCMLLIIWTSAVFQFWSVEQRVDLKYRLLVVLTMAAAVLRPTLGIILVLNSNDRVMALILGMVVVDVAAYTWLFFVQMHKGKLFFDKGIWKYALAFNIPLIPHYLSMSILTGSDRIMIERLVGASESGIYNVAHGLAFIMTMFNTALMQTIEPWLYKKIKRKEIHEISSVAYPTFIIIACVNILLMALAPELIAVFAPPVYYEAVWVIPPLAMSVYCMFAYCFFAVFEFYYEKTKWVMGATTVCAVLNIMLNYFCIKLFGYVAAGYTTLVCYILYASFHYLSMRRICRKNLENANPYSLKSLLVITGIFMMVGFVFLFTYRYRMIRYSLLCVIIAGLLLKRRELISIIQRMISLKREKSAD